MVPVLSSEGEKINWVNYKTGQRDIFFRMQADHRKAVIAIEITHRDAGVQQRYFEQLAAMRNIFEDFLGGDWHWQLHGVDEQGKLVSRVFAERENLSIFRKEDWPGLISFFKPRIIGLDAFWSLVKSGLDAVR